VAHGDLAEAEIEEIAEVKMRLKKKVKNSSLLKMK
jgi:hypothetical protein